MRNKMVSFVVVFFTIVFSYMIAEGHFGFTPISLISVIPIALIIASIVAILVPTIGNKEVNDNISSCDPEIWKKGETVFVTHSIPLEIMERWVRKVADRSKQRVGWSFIGGRAVVRALGDLDKVKVALNELKSEHDDLYLKILKEDHPAIYACDEYRNSPGRMMI